MDPFPENIKKAFDFVADVTKQMILLATGLVGFSVTFIKELTGGATISGCLRTELFCSWISLVISVAAGIGAMLTLSGNLEKQKILSVYTRNTRLFSVVQIFAFLLGIVLFASFSIQTLDIVHVRQ